VTKNNISSDVVPLLEAVDVRKSYSVQAGWTRGTSATALAGVSVQAWDGRTLAIAGESGCGKSTLGRLLLGLVSPDSGEIRFAGHPLGLSLKSSRREFRRAVQMVFQNPLASFNPMLTVSGTIRDMLWLRNDLSSRKARTEEAEHLACQVGLDAWLIKRYPSELSAGQLQKASIARALATKPRIVFLDEPTSALDASGRRQIIDLLLTLQRELGLGYVLVSHDFHVIGAMTHHMVVMYLGQIVEEGPADEVLQRPLHPYSRALVAASSYGFARQSKLRMRGEISQPPVGYQGCRLHPRCPYAVNPCQQPQSLVSVEPRHTVRCWQALEIERSENQMRRSNLVKGEPS
jgi:oligopeptide/dipeptide ABC transporter ATP-binding protein